MSAPNERTLMSIPLVFFFILYFLIFIPFLSSLWSTLHFFFTLEIKYSASPLPKIGFMVFTLLYLLNPNSGKMIYEFLTNAHFMEFVSKAGVRLEKFTIKNPVLCVSVAYAYGMLLLLHLLMHLVINDVDIFVDYVYHCLNIIRLFVFPIFIYVYIVFYSPKDL
jgi:hypothetical protein